jgi:hypothetical protein
MSRSSIPIAVGEASLILTLATARRWPRHALPYLRATLGFTRAVLESDKLADVAKDMQIQPVAK